MGRAGRGARARVENNAQDTRRCFRSNVHGGRRGQWPLRAPANPSLRLALTRYCPRALFPVAAWVAAFSLLGLVAHAQDDPDFERRLRLQNTAGGLTGGVHVIDARPAPSGSFRAQLAADHFAASNFLNDGDTHSRVGAQLTLNLGLFDRAEAFVNLKTLANANDSEEPDLFQVLGDLTVGAKMSRAIQPWLHVGGSLSVLFLNSVGDIGLEPSATGLDASVHLTADTREASLSLPLIARFNATYHLDNSGELVEGIEDDRYDALDPATRAPRDQESRNLVSRVERFALGINRVDRVTLALGFEVPLEVSPRFAVHPLLEGTLAVPVNRQGYDCTQPAAGSDSDRCLADVGFAAYPVNATLGARVFPWVRGLSVFAAVDIGLSGASTFAQELAPHAPYAVRLGIAFANDPRSPQKPPEPVACPEPVDDVPQCEPPPPPRADPLEPDCSQCPCEPPRDAAPAEAPAPAPPSARIVLPNAALSPVTAELTGPQSRTLVLTAPSTEVRDLEPGSYRLQVTDKSALARAVSLQVTADETTQIDLELTPRPERPRVKRRGRTIVLGRRITFDPQTRAVRDVHQGTVEQLADLLLRSQDIVSIVIAVHTDNQGRPAQLRERSQQQADALKASLVALGVRGELIQANGMGMSKPRVPNITRANRAKNRRVTVRIDDTL